MRVLDNSVTDRALSILAFLRRIPRCAPCAFGEAGMRRTSRHHIGRVHVPARHRAHAVIYPFGVLRGPGRKTEGRQAPGHVDHPGDDVQAGGRPARPIPGLNTYSRRRRPIRTSRPVPPYPLHPLARHDAYVARLIGGGGCLRFSTGRLELHDIRIRTEIPDARGRQEPQRRAETPRRCRVRRRRTDLYISIVG